MMMAQEIKVFISSVQREFVKERRQLCDYIRTDALLGKIEHLGTGTMDMIVACEQYGLREPEFRQAEDFRTVIYRKEKVSDLNEKVSDPSEKVTEFSEKVTNLDEKVTELNEKSNRARLTAKQRKVLEFCDEMPRTAREIIEMIGVRYHTRTLEQYINKLVFAGLLRPTNAKSHDQNRKYITAHGNDNKKEDDQ